jgi:hypothetical protein
MTRPLAPRLTRARQAEVLSEALLGAGVAILELPPKDALAVVSRTAFCSLEALTSVRPLGRGALTPRAPPCVGSCRTRRCLRRTRSSTRRAPPSRRTPRERASWTAGALTTDTAARRSVRPLLLLLLLLGVAPGVFACAHARVRVHNVSRARARAAHRNLPPGCREGGDALHAPPAVAPWAARASSSLAAAARIVLAALSRAPELRPRPGSGGLGRLMQDAPLPRGARCASILLATRHTAGSKPAAKPLLLLEEEERDTHIGLLSLVALQGGAALEVTLPGAGAKHVLLTPRAGCVAVLIGEVCVHAALHTCMHTCHHRARSLRVCAAPLLR